MNIYSNSKSVFLLITVTLTLSKRLIVEAIFFDNLKTVRFVMFKVAGEPMLALDRHQDGQLDGQTR